MICEYFMFMVDEVGVFLLFIGIAELNFTHNHNNISNNGDTHHIPIGKGSYVFQGGSFTRRQNHWQGQYRLWRGSNRPDFCVQGSTNDHLVPPLPSDLNSSKDEILDVTVAASESYDGAAAKLQVLSILNFACAYIMK